jgi:hypothetical protein
MQRLYVAAHIHEAHLVRGLLAATGIDARVLNEYAPGAGGELPLTEIAPEVWIDDDGDMARARCVIEDYERAATTGGAQRCGACGEESPPDFAVCWHCQRPL